MPTHTFYCNTHCYRPYQWNIEKRRESVCIHFYGYDSNGFTEEGECFIQWNWGFYKFLFSKNSMEIFSYVFYHDDEFRGLIQSAFTPSQIEVKVDTSTMQNESDFQTLEAQAGHLKKKIHRCESVHVIKDKSCRHRTTASSYMISSEKYRWEITRDEATNVTIRILPIAGHLKISELEFKKKADRYVIYRRVLEIAGDLKRFVSLIATDRQFERVIINLNPHAINVFIPDDEGENEVHEVEKQLEELTDIIKVRGCIVRCTHKEQQKKIPKLELPKISGKNSVTQTEELSQSITTRLPSITAKHIKTGSRTARK